MIEFYCGVMGAGKSLELINMVYKLSNSKLKFATVCMNHEGYIESRFFNEGAEADFDYIDYKKLEKYDIILIDECQFMTEDDIYTLYKLSKKGIIIKCYGLLTTGDGTMFNASSKLIPLCQKIYTIENFCECCQKELATHHIKTNAKANDFNKTAYASVCFDCYMKECKKYE